MRIKKGDTIFVRSGKERGKTGKVLRVLADTQRILVEGLNTYKKRSRPKRQGEAGETVQLSRSIHESNVMLYCSSCGKGSRVGIRTEGKKGAKVRFCKRCNNIL